ncbi:MAG: hypothetical protein ACRCTJ_02320 [Brevinema sp.]
MEQPHKLLEVNVNQLVLDKDNLRIRYRINLEKKEPITEDIIIEYLKKFEKLADLKNAILDEGWDSPNEPFVVPLDNGTYLVKEGNRRIASIKSLIKENKNIPDWTGQISVKIYNNIELLNKHISKTHTDGIYQWDPWGKALDDAMQKKSTAGAHLISFILTNQIREILENEGCYTILTEALSRSREILGIHLSNDGFDYVALGAIKTKVVIKEVLKAYKKGLINTRTREEWPKILTDIKNTLEKTQFVEDTTESMADTNIFNFSEINEAQKNKTTDINNDNSDTNDSKAPRRKYPDSITNETFKEWLEVLLRKYSSQTNGNVSFLLLKDLKDMPNTKYTNERIILCRTIWEALLQEYFTKKPKEEHDKKASVETKSESICGRYTAKLKTVFPEIDDIAKYAQRHIGLLNDVVHGSVYKNEASDLYTSLTDLYPLFRVLVNLINDKDISE